MMKLRSAFLVLLATGLTAIALQPVFAQTVDDVIAKNLEARGGIDKIKAVKSAQITGHMTITGAGEAPFNWKWKRPSMLRVEFTLQGMTAIQAYDGKAGWMVMPFLGKKDPEPMGEEELKHIDEQSDFDGPLVDYKEKGNQVELLGKESVEGTDAYKLKLTRKNGDVTILYLDSESYLEIKTEAKRMIRGMEMEIESSQGDYKEVGGLLIPHSIESRPKGAPEGQTITFDKVELNVDVPAAEFTMPEVKAAPSGEEKPSAKPASPAAR